MTSQKSRRIAGTLAQEAQNTVDAAQVADKIVLSLREIEDALSPVIGKGGVAALFRRSLYLTGRSYPSLAGIHAGDATTIDSAALKSELAQQSSATATEFGVALLQTLDEVMTSLVGSSLTERLLGSVWSNLSIKTPAQDDPV